MAIQCIVIIIEGATIVASKYELLYRVKNSYIL